MHAYDNSGCSVSAKPISAASETADLAAKIAALAEEVANRSSSILAGVMREPSPNCEQDVPEPIRAYPPLFSDIRNHLFSIRTSLDVITSYLNRSEL